jgi:cytochrome c-type biogenesis protein CcmH/NrfG
MDEQWLLVLLILVMLLGVVALFFPFRRSRVMLYGVSPVLVFVVLLLLYWHWGAYPLLLNQAQKRHVASMVASMGGIETLMQKLKQRIAQKPRRAKGWYLLAKLQLAQGQLTEAMQALTRAHDLAPEDDLITLTYAEVSWDMHHRAFDDGARNAVIAVLAHDANQPDALAMLAMDAYQRQAYQEAINYWERLLPQLPAKSAEADALRQAIVRARADGFFDAGAKLTS